MKTSTIVIIAVLLIAAFGFIYFSTRNSGGYQIAMDNDSSSQNTVTEPDNSAPSEPPQQGTTEMIDIASFAFSPNVLTIKVGTTVVWTNEDTAPHTVTSDAGTTKELDSGSMSKGEEYSHTFTSAGEYKYHCVIHPGMKGTIIVE